MSLAMSTAERYHALCKKRDEKEKEIQRRREVVETTSATSLSKKKDEAKVYTLDIKIQQKKSASEKQIHYYQTEIQRAEEKLERDKASLEEKLAAAKRELEAKFEVTLKGLESKFTSYRQYCQGFIEQEQSKLEAIIQPLEQKKELVQDLSQKAEDDDKVLVRLKVEHKQLEDKVEEARKEMEKLFVEEQEKMAKQRAIMVREEMERLHQAEVEARRLALQQLEIKKDQEKAEKERRYRNRELYTKEVSAS